jgi:alkylation response protein AidB-like acyl-CoA dehydrogenase
MNFDDTPQEAEFRTTARKWIDANAPKQYEAELSKSSLGRIRLERRRSSMSARPGRRRRLKAAGPACTGRRNMAAAAPADREGDLAAGRGVYGKLTQPFQIGEHVRPDRDGVRQRGAQAALSPKLASGVHIWCQLFSEPAGGSDVAGAHPRGRRATTGSSTARRSGPRARIIPTTAF